MIRFATSALMVMAAIAAVITIVAALQIWVTSATVGRVSSEPMHSDASYLDNIGMYQTGLSHSGR